MGLSVRYEAALVGVSVRQWLMIVEEGGKRKQEEAERNPYFIWLFLLTFLQDGQRVHKRAH